METRRGEKAKLAAVGEDALVRFFRRAEAGAGRGVILGPGDDAAMVRCPSGARLLLTTDLLAEDVHFRRAWAAPEDLGFKLAAINVSDIGAMGGRPLWALLSLALPPDLEAAFVFRLWRGLRAASRLFRMTVVGGDTCASRSGILLSLALIGTAGPRLLTRASARPGDILFVTGHLGASTLGLAALERHGGERVPRALAQAVRRHRRPDPPLAFAAALAARNLATAAIDVSDGLSRDLTRLCGESRVGAEVEADRLPLLPATRDAAVILGRDPLAAALHGGEEYELLFTVRPEIAKKVETFARRAAVPATMIGRILPEPRRIMLVESGGRRRPLTPLCWEHFVDTCSGTG